VRCNPERCTHYLDEIEELPEPSLNAIPATMAMRCGCLPTVCCGLWHAAYYAKGLTREETLEDAAQYVFAHQCLVERVWQLAASIERRTLVIHFMWCKNSTHGKMIQPFGRSSGVVAIFPYWSWIEYCCCMTSMVSKLRLKQPEPLSVCMNCTNETGARPSNTRPRTY